MTVTDTPAVTAPPPPAVRPVPTDNLTYEQTTPWFAQRRAFRLIVLLLILNIVAVTSITWGPITVRAVQERMAAKRAAEAQAQAAAAQQQAAAAKAAADQSKLAQRAALVRQCLTFPLPAGRGVHTEDFVEAAKLLADGKAGYSAVNQVRTNPSARLPHPPVRWDGTPELRTATAALRRGDVSGTLFLGERKTPSGQGRLVWAFVNAKRDATTEYADGTNLVLGPVERQLHAYVMDPAHPTDPGKVLWTYQLDILQHLDRRVRVVVEPPSNKPNLLRNSIERPGETLRLMAGSADPGDPTRLTIPYSLDDRRGEIELRLQDDDRLRVAVDRGEKEVASFDRSVGRESWDMRAGEAKPDAKPDAKRNGRR